MGFGTLSLKGRALRLLSQREHSRSELQRKLAPHVQDGEDLAAILDDLEARDFISAARVVESVVHQRAARMGAARIRQELQAKGIAPDAIHAAVAALQDTELERARGVWQRRFEGPPQDARQRGQQMRFLLARGFSADVAARVIRSAEAAGTDPAD